MTKKQIKKQIENGKMPKVTDYKLKDFEMILGIYGYRKVGIRNSSHAKFTNDENNHSVVVSGYASNKVDYPIAQKILKEVHTLHGLHRDKLAL